MLKTLNVATWRATLSRFKESTRTSLLVVPGLIIALAVLASFATLMLDERLEHTRLTTVIFQAGPDGARSTLSAIASSVMTVGGVAFSLTIVVVQLASTQFSPRVVRSFLRSRIIQVVLGTYMGTFTYSLLVLRRVSEKHDSIDLTVDFVPTISVSVAIILGVTCMVLLVVFINHVTRSVQVPALVGSIVDEAVEAARHLYPDEIGSSTGVSSDAPRPGDPAAGVGDDGDELLASASGYLGYVDEGAFAALPKGVTLRIVLQTGDYGYAGDCVARVFPAGAIDEAARLQAARAFSFVSERTIRQDIGFAIRLIVDVAVRALSPGVNDPTTAVYCVNELGRVLNILASRRFPSEVRSIGHTTIIAPRPTFSDLVRAAYFQIIHYGRQDLDVMCAVAGSLRSLRRRCGEETGVVELLRMLDQAAAEAPWPAPDREQLRASLRGEAAARPASTAGIIHSESP